MKTIKVTSILLLAGHILWGQAFEFGSTLNVSQPVGTMARNMNNAFGISLESSRQFKTPFSAGLQLNFGNYGRQTTRQEFTFDDGSVTETDVNVSNNILNASLTGKHFLRNDKKINPYLSAKAGWTWFTTNLTIEDPADQYSCHPIDSDILSRDNTYTFSGGVGLRVDFQTFFKKTDADRFYFDISVHGTHGGIVGYMNVKKDRGQSIPDQDVTAKFIHTQTQVIHEHHVGYLYRSVLNMVDYRFGVVFRPECK
ncbi:MAG TPA: hypothetical protein VIQ51_13425 [Chryseosolibacter sp.]